MPDDITSQHRRFLARGLAAGAGVGIGLAATRPNSGRRFEERWVKASVVMGCTHPPFERFRTVARSPGCARLWVDLDVLTGRWVYCDLDHHLSRWPVANYWIQRRMPIPEGWETNRHVVDTPLPPASQQWREINGQVTAEMTPGRFLTFPRYIKTTWGRDLVIGGWYPSDIRDELQNHWFDLDLITGELHECPPDYLFLKTALAADPWAHEKRAS